MKPDLKLSTFTSNNYNGYNYILHEKLVLLVIDFMWKLSIGHLDGDEYIKKWPERSYIRRKVEDIDMNCFLYKVFEMH
jgi:hypothetical protein